MEDAGLSAAREQLQQAEARLKHLKRAFASDPDRVLPEGGEDWRKLSRDLSRLRDLLASWAPDIERSEAAGDPDWRRRKNEIEARALRAETAFRELEQKQEALDLGRERVLAELERVQEGWRLLREEAQPNRAELPEGTLSALIEKTQQLTSLWERLMAQQGEALRECERVDGLWRWIVSVSMPTFEKKAAESDQTLALPTLRRLLDDLDRRWRALRGGAKLGGPPQPPAIESLVRERDGEFAKLSTELEAAKAALAQARKESALWQGLRETARKDVEKMLAKFTESQEEIQELHARLKAVKDGQNQRDRQLAEETSVLKDRLAKAQDEIAELNRRLERPQDAEKIAELNLQIENWKREEERLRKEAKANLEGLVAHFSKDEEEFHALREELEVTKAALSQEQSRSKELLAEYDARLNKTKEESIALWKRVEGIRQERDTAVQQGGLLSGELSAERKHAAALEERVAELKRELESTRSALTAAQSKVETAKAEDQRSHQTSAALEATLENERRTEGALRQQNAALAGRLEQAQTELAALGRQLQLLQEEKSRAEADARRASGPAVPIPTVEPVLDPAWTKVLETLRQPLTAAYNRLRQLSPSALPEGQKVIVKLAASSLAQASDTVKVLGDFLEEAPAEAGSCRVEAVIDSTLASWEPALRLRKVTVVRSIDRDIPPSAFHSDALRTAVYQILRNAYEAMPQGGILTVKVWKDGASAQARASFLDTGPGFSPEALGRLFKPFSSTKPGHLGLGLALVQRALRRHGGEAAAENPGKGALVTLRFGATAGELPALSDGDPPRP